jgi:hypothetical protein
VAVFAGGVATTKGRESIVWFFGGFLAGPIALIAIAGMPTSLEEAETKAWLAERRKEQEEAKRQRRARGRT